MTNINKLINQFIYGDALEVMRRLPNSSIDLIVTSPPYNLRNSTGHGMKSKNSKWEALINGYACHDDCMPYEKYIKWQRDCLSEMMRLLKKDGAIFYNHKWRVQNGLIQDRQDIVSGFPVRQIIIWKRKGGINFNDSFFLPTYEVIYLIAKKEFRLIPKANGYGDVWEFCQDMNNPHPAPFPVSLVERIISSTKAKVILDPFIGSGTTAIAAKKLGRAFIGIDNAKEYIQIAQKRLNNFKKIEEKICI